MFKFIKSIFLWVLVKKNRQMTFKVVKQTLVALSIISKVTKSDKDNMAIKRVQEILEPVLKDLPEKTRQNAINAINKEPNTFDVGWNEKEGLNAGISLKL